VELKLEVLQPKVFKFQIAIVIELTLVEWFRIWPML
jgi:hypothetical protein